MAIDLRAKRARLAACLAISNLGLEVPKDAAEHPERWGSDAADTIIQLAGHFCESDDHERIFRGEARMCYNYVKVHSREHLTRIYGHHCPWVEAIMYAED